MARVRGYLLEAVGGEGDSTTTEEIAHIPNYKQDSPSNTSMCSRIVCINAYEAFRSIRGAISSSELQT